MEIINNSDLFSLIAKKLAGYATYSESLQLSRWLESSAKNKQFFQEILNIWDVSGELTQAENIDTNKAFTDVKRRIEAGSYSKRAWFYWQKIAAIVAVPLILFSLVSVYTNIINKANKKSEVAYNEVFAAFGTRSSLLLSDSTVVWLNSGSSLKYPLSFNDKERKVFLSGEAYFEVESDESKPFIVETATLQVKATGTIFNVQEYEDSDIAEVSLISGIVVVNESDKVNGNRIITKLQPNQLLIYNRGTKEKSINTEDVQMLTAWKDGKLIFRNEPLDVVLKRISKLFNVDIELRGEELKSYRYRATFQDESLEEILKLLKISAPLSFMEIKRNPLPDGSFPKKKVIIYPTN